MTTKHNISMDYVKKNILGKINIKVITKTQIFFKNSWKTIGLHVKVECER